MGSNGVTISCLLTLQGRFRTVVYCIRIILLISPCRQQCKLIEGVCQGCGRTLKQIVDWTKYTDDERKEIIKKLDSTQ